MSTTQVARSGHQSFSGRGSRLIQPQLKEDRKTAVPKDLIQMPDGTFITPATFHSMRSASHQKFTGGVGGMSERVRQKISRLEWGRLVAWMDSHRGNYGDKTRQNDNFLAVLLDHAAVQTKSTAGEVLNSIIQNRSASILLSTRQ